MGESASDNCKESKSVTSQGETLSTMETSLSTLLTDPQDMFHHSISDLDSFSKSLDFDRHLPSVEDREDFLNQFMGEEEINPEEPYQSSFAYDLESSIPTRLGTIIDHTECDTEVDEDEFSLGDLVESLPCRPKVDKV